MFSLERLFVSTEALIGLAIGLLVFAVTFPIGWSYLQADRFVPRYENVYRLDLGGTDSSAALVPGSITSLASSGYLERSEAIDEVTQLSQPQLITLSAENSKGVSQRIHIVETTSNVFDFFGLSIVAGSSDELRSPDSIALSLSMKHALFGSRDAIGQQVEAVNGRVWQVVVVFEDVPESSHLFFEALQPFQTPRPTGIDAWLPSVFTYFRSSGDEYETNEALKELNAANPITQFIYKSTPLSDLAYDDDAIARFKPARSRFALISFTAIATIVLFFAILTSANFASVRVAENAQTIGLLKVWGAPVYRVVITSSVSLIVLVGLLCLSIIPLASMVSEFVINTAIPGARIAGAKFQTWHTWASLLAAFMVISSVLIVVVIAYSRTPIALLLNMKDRAFGSISLLRASAVVQTFAIVAISFFAIISTDVTSRTLRNADYVATEYRHTLSLTPSKEISKTSLFAEFSERIPSILQNLRDRSLVSQFTTSDTLLPGSFVNTRQVAPDGAEGFDVPFIEVGDGFFNFFEYELIAGRYFMDRSHADRVDLGADSSVAVATQSLASLLGYKDAIDSIGSTLRVRQQNSITGELGSVVLRIVGVVEDKQILSLRENPLPILFVKSNVEFPFVYFEVAPTAGTSEINEINERILQPFGNPTHFLLSLKEELSDLNRNSESLSQLLLLISTATIALVGLSYLVLVRMLAAKRQTELALNRLYGANRSHIVLIILKEILPSILIGTALAVGLGFYLISAFAQTMPLASSIVTWKTAIPPLTIIFVLTVVVSMIVSKIVRRPLYYSLST